MNDIKVMSIKAKLTDRNKAALYGLVPHQWLKEKLLSLLVEGNKVLMKELEENTIEQIRTLLNYLEQTDLLKNKEILRCLDVIAREYGGEVVDKN